MVAVEAEMVAMVAGAAVVTAPMDLDMDLVVVAHTHPVVVAQQVVVEVEQQQCCSPLWV